jgi:predicted nucleic acid-binding Zn ribbon protein
MAFSQRRGLDKHLITHTTPSIPCEVCGKLVKTKETLYTHLKTVHSLTREGDEVPVGMEKKSKLVELVPSPCEVCGKVIPKRNAVLCSKRNYKFHS